MDKLSCEQIISRYYRELFNYISVRLRYDKQSAEDCTQELFIVFFRKHEVLENSSNIRLWLYRTADNVILEYLRKNNTGTVSLEECPEAMNIPSPEPIDDDDGELLSEYLSPDEIELVKLYYDSGYGERDKTAAKLGITITALYQKIHKIKEKLKKRMK